MMNARQKLHESIIQQAEQIVDMERGGQIGITRVPREPAQKMDRDLNRLPLIPLKQAAEQKRRKEAQEWAEKMRIYLQRFPPPEPHKQRMRRELEERRKRPFFEGMPAEILFKDGDLTKPRFSFSNDVYQPTKPKQQPVAASTPKKLTPNRITQSRPQTRRTPEPPSVQQRVCPKCKIITQMDANDNVCQACLMKAIAVDDILAEERLKEVEELLNIMDTTTPKPPQQSNKLDVPRYLTPKSNRIPSPFNDPRNDSYPNTPTGRYHHSKNDQFVQYGRGDVEYNDDWPSKPVPPNAEQRYLGKSEMPFPYSSVVSPPSLRPRTTARRTLNF